jgi:epoxyqueuosine reductase
MSKFDLQAWAENEGWSLAGACDIKLPEHIPSLYKTWLEKYKGPQMNYLSRRIDERLDPQKYFSEAKSIIAFALYYYPGSAEGDLKVSNYAWGKDYHDVLKDKLEASAQKLQKLLGPFDYRVCTDTSPLLEKTLAQEAGLGWQGKNTLLINPEHGSYLFLGEILTSLPLDRFEENKKITNHCGTCTRCIDACPTDALEPFVLDAKKCISYWTLEHKGEFDKTTPDFHGWLAGCDICQDV